MKPTITMAAVQVLMAMLLAAGASEAQERKVIARVAGDPVYEDELGYAEIEVAEELAQADGAQRRALLLRYLINTRLLAAAGIKAGLEGDDAYLRRIEYHRRQALRDAYVDRLVGATIDEKALRDIYQRDYAGVTADEEVRARHILLQSESEAKEIGRRLTAGEDFVGLARSVSAGPSGQSGGELGWFGRGQMTQSFEEAVFALQPGQISQPVESRFGWHIIKLEERRRRPVPSFEEVREQIRGPLLLEKAREVVEKMRAETSVEIPDAALADAMKGLR